MRVRTTVAGLVAFVAGLAGGQAPAQAAPSASNVHMAWEMSCFGCGTSTYTGWWWCYGVCVIDGNVCIGQCHYRMSGWTEFSATCPATGSATGVIEFPDGARSFTMTWVGNTWVMTTEFGAVAQGVLAVTSPVGNPCGGPASVTFAGAMTGA